MLYFNILLIIIIHHIRICSSQSINEIAAKIASKEFLDEAPTLVSWWETSSENINEFISKYIGQVVTANLNELKNQDSAIRKTFIHEQNVLFVQNVDEFHTFINSVYKLSIKPERMFLVISQPQQNVTEFTAVAWQNDLVNIIILNENIRNEITLHTYIPYSDGRCGDYNPVPLTLNHSNLFIKKFRNFQKCPVRVLAYPIEPYVVMTNKRKEEESVRGIDTDFIKLILEKLNATVKIIIENNESNQNETNHKANITSSSSFDDLEINNADILIPAVIIDEEKLFKVQLSYALKNVDVVWSAPPRREIFVWAKVILPFLSHISLYILLSFIIFIVAVKIIYRFEKCKKRRNNIVFASIALFLGQVIKFQTKNRALNYVFIAWIWYCCVIRIAYQSDLIKGLHKVILEAPIETIDQGLNLLDEVVGISVVEEAFEDTPVSKRFKIVRYEDIPEYLNRVANGERILLAVNKSLITYHRYNLQVLKDNVSRYPICFFMRPRWAASSEVDYMITIASQSGFLVHIDAIYLELWLKEGRTFSSNAKHKKEAMPLNMPTLNSCFYGLLICYVVSTIILCLEIVWSKAFWKKNKGPTC